VVGTHKLQGCDVPANLEKIYYSYLAVFSLERGEERLGKFRENQIYFTSPRQTFPKLLMCLYAELNRNLSQRLRYQGLAERLK
jgi:hypothetical protein